MIWVFVFGGIALAGLAMLVAYVIWLAHKASDVFAELRVLAERGGRLADIVSQVKMPELPANDEEIRSDRLPLRDRGRGVRRRGSQAGHR